jgi:glycerophosphoryl diester phosphodiesterase
MLRTAFAFAFSVLSAATAFCVEIIAHRGASADAPENTLAAMNAAWAQGADAVELDIYLSKDGRLIVFHDTTTRRFENPARKIVDLTLDEARLLDVGLWKSERFKGERVPLLEDVLATIPRGKRAVLELKSGAEIVPELARVLTAVARPAGETCIISFSHSALEASKKALPGLQHYFLSGWKRDEKTGSGPDFDALLEKAKSAGFDGLNLSQDWPLEPGMVARAGAAGMKLMVWTVNDARLARRLEALGIDAITTDRPGALRSDLSAAFLPDSKTDEGRLRVVSFNILGGRNPDNAHDLNRAAAIIRALNPDLVALQEVDVKTKRFRGRDLPAELATLTGMKAYFAEAMPFSGGSYGVALLSRLPVERRENHKLPGREKSEPRAAAEIVCLLGGNTRIRFAGTHLDHQDAEDDRLMQTARLLELLPDPASPPSILAGDFNAAPSAASLRQLMTKWNIAWPQGEAPFTWPAIGAKVAIDHVFTAGPWKVTRSGTALDAFPGDSEWKSKIEAASDHLPIFVELQLGKL